MVLSSDIDGRAVKESAMWRHDIMARGWGAVCGMASWREEDLCGDRIPDSASAVSLNDTFC